MKTKKVWSTVAAGSWLSACLGALIPAMPKQTKWSPTSARSKGQWPQTGNLQSMKGQRPQTGNQQLTFASAQTGSLQSLFSFLGSFRLSYLGTSRESSKTVWGLHPQSSYRAQMGPRPGERGTRHPDPVPRSRRTCISGDAGTQPRTRVSGSGRTRTRRGPSTLHHTSG